MTTLDENIREQLSAWMDGELPADEARFLERRLANEPALRAHWERMQLASSCLKGHALRPMPAVVSQRIAAAIAEPVQGSTKRRAWLGWAVAASVAALAVLVLPNMGGGIAPVAVPVAAQHVAPADAGRVSVQDIVATPASADLVASNAATTDTATMAVAPVRNMAHSPTATPVVASTIADNGQSPADFPLVAPNSDAGWPRSPLATDGNDPALEAYLIRHNQMMSDDGLSGFVPYVDVVANDPQSNADAGEKGEANR